MPTALLAALVPTSGCFDHSVGAVSTPHTSRCRRSQDRSPCGFVKLDSQRLGLVFSTKPCDSWEFSRNKHHTFGTDPLE